MFDTMQQSSSSKVDFLAEEEHIEIVPNFPMAVIRLCEGNYGPFRPNHKISVPFWLAQHLRRMHRCKLVLPEWLTIENLRNAVMEEEEEENRTRFTKTNPFYMSVAAMLLEVGREDIEDDATVWNQLQDMWDRRKTKIRNGMHALTGDDRFIQMNNISLLELDGARPVFMKALDQFRQLEEVALSVSS